jgi:beta-glucosidase
MSVSNSGRLGRPRRLLDRIGIVAVVAFVAACGNSNATGTPNATGTSGASSAPSVAASGANSDRPWMDATKTVDQRVAALLSVMTLDEKIGQMTQVQNNSIDPGNLNAFAIGSVLSGGGGSPNHGSSNTPQAWYDMVNAYQQAALGTRLGIPMIYGIDAVHGDNNVYGSTIFPHNVGMGATHDPALVTKECQATALEMNAVGIRWTFGPVIAVPQDVRWGRTYEGYSENTDLVSQLGVACVKGFQGSGNLSAPDTAAVTLKHFIGDGGTAYGSSQTSNYILDQGKDPFDEAKLLSLFLPPYKAAVDSGARIVMTSYSSTTAGKVHGDKHLITDILKTQLGFTGFVVSDWGGIDQVVPGDYNASVVQSINAGIDMVMVPDNYHSFMGAMSAAAKAGTIPQSRIDDAVSRILRVKFEMGLFENPMPAAGKLDEVGAAADRAIAEQAVAESAVLLKTSGGALPIASTAKVLLAGQGANDIGVASGGWTISWQGAPGPITTGTTLNDALAAKLGANLKYDPAANFAAGTKADVGVVVVAEQPYAEGVGDSSTLELPANDVAVIAKMKPLVNKLIVVVYSGRPMLISSFAGSADAVIAAWLPGTEATGLADVLLGTKPFTGTTPYTWPKTVDDAPRTDKTACDGAVYPFGYGLDATGKLLGPAAC